MLLDSISELEDLSPSLDKIKFQVSHPFVSSITTTSLAKGFPWKLLLDEPRLL
jgi:hypothetical protein